MPPSALVVTGPVGVGKTEVLHEADRMLVEFGSRHATVEMEEIVRFWPIGGSQEAAEGLGWRNLAALWANFAEAGADRLLVSGLFESRSELVAIEQSISGSKILVVQLRASLSVLEERIRGRQAEPEHELSAARWWFQHLEKVRVGDHVIDTDSLSARAVAAVMLRVAGWLS